MLGQFGVVYGIEFNIYITSLNDKFNGEQWKKENKDTNDHRMQISS